MLSIIWMLHLIQKIEIKSILTIIGKNKKLPFPFFTINESFVVLSLLKIISIPNLTYAKSGVPNL